MTPSLCSPESEGSTSASNAPDGRPSSKPRKTPTAAPSSPTDSPASPASPTLPSWRKATKARGPDDLERWEQTTIAGTLSAHSLGLPGSVLTSSTAGSPAKTYPRPESDEGSPEPAPDCSSSSPESLTLFDPHGSSLRTWTGCSPRTMVGTSESSWERWPTSGTASRGECSTHDISESPNDAVECSLSAILEATAHPRYTLSARAARGILRRAAVRGRNLPPVLEDALRQVAGEAET